MTYQIVAAVNSPEVMQSNLASSQIVRNGIPCLAQIGYSSASKAYNDAIMRCNSRIIIFAHQDVYIPGNWFQRLENAIECLGDKPWAVLGIIGKTQEGQVVGRTWSTGIGREVGCPVREPVKVESIDELIFVVNRTTGIMFDENLPGFHLYGTDIVQIANKAGYDAYVFDGPVVHNSLPVARLDQSYRDAYRYMQKKWQSILPIDTLIIPITRFAWPLYKRRIEEQMKFGVSRDHFRRLDDPLSKSREMGYE